MRHAVYTTLYMHIDLLSYFYGVLTFVILGVLLRGFVKQRAAWYTWYRGLPVWKYGGIFFVLLGTRILKRGGLGVRSEHFNGRMWYSPSVFGFVEEKL